MAKYSEAMRAVWAKKTPEERSSHARRLARHRWRLLRKLNTHMATITYTADDGTVTNFVDAATIVAPTGEVVKDVVVENEDGTSETMDPASAA